MYKAIFFDLDGTLTESGEGITKSVQYALEKLGVSAPDLEPLKVFVGPPLLDQFMKYAGFDKETAQKGIEYYRERYSEKGMYENTVYPGVENALAELKRRGYRLAVASAKPTFYVTQIMDHFNLSRYFEVIAGTDLNGPKVSKSQVIEEALKEADVTLDDLDAISKEINADSSEKNSQETADNVQKAEEENADSRDTQTAQQDAIKYLLEKYPDVKGIFATNETVADLVVNVLDSMDKITGEDRIKVVSFDGGEDQMKLLEDGKIDGLIVQNPYGIGYATVVACARAVLGQGNEAMVSTGYTWVTKDNMNKDSIKKMLY